MLLIWILFELKHFLADFLFQNSWMSLGKTKAQGWINPLAIHCIIHLGFSFPIIFFFQPKALWLFPVEGFIHFTMDRIKGSPNILSRQWHDPAQRKFWWILGFDQMVHRLNYVLMAYYLLK